MLLQDASLKRVLLSVTSLSAPTAKLRLGHDPVNWAIAPRNSTSGGCRCGRTLPAKSEPSSRHCPSVSSSAPSRSSEQSESRKALRESVAMRLLASLKLISGQLPASWVIWPEIRTPVLVEELPKPRPPQAQTTRASVSAAAPSHDFETFGSECMFILHEV